MRGIVLDANLFLLLVVGSFQPARIRTHRRLNSQYTETDFRSLLDFIASFDTLIAVPNSLAEVSNFLSDGDDPVSIGIKQSFANFIREAVEIYQPSAEAISCDEFWWLGLNDTAQILAAGNDHTLLTADGALFDSAIRRGAEAVHFSTLQEHN